MPIPDSAAGLGFGTMRPPPPPPPMIRPPPGSQHSWVLPPPSRAPAPSRPPDNTAYPKMPGASGAPAALQPTAAATEWEISRRVHEELQNRLPEAHMQDENARRQAVEAFQTQVRAGIPLRAQSWGATELDPEEWDTEVVPASALSSRGGIALVPKGQLASVVARVGTTFRPVAIVTTEHAQALGLWQYRCREIWCSIKTMPRGGGATSVLVRRHLTQLSMDDEATVRMKTHENDVLVEVAPQMAKMVMRFDQAGGWQAGDVTGLLVAESLVKIIPDGSFSNITIRDGGSATFLVWMPLVDDVLRQSGEAHIYIKVHIEEPAGSDIELLWLPRGTSRKEACTAARQAPGSLGVALKQSREGPLYGVRFRDAAALDQLATALELQAAHMARFKVSPVTDVLGAVGLMGMLEAPGIEWAVSSVVFLGEGHAIVEAPTAPPITRFCQRDVSGFQTTTHIRTVNGAARRLCAARNLPAERADEDGEDAPAQPPADAAAAIRARARKQMHRNGERLWKLCALTAARPAADQPTLRVEDEAMTGSGGLHTGGEPGAQSPGAHEGGGLTDAATAHTDHAAKATSVPPLPVLAGAQMGGNPQRPSESEDGSGEDTPRNAPESERSRTPRAGGPPADTQVRRQEHRAGPGAGGGSH